MGLAAIAATTVGKIFIGVVALLLILGGTGVAFFAADYGFEATVVETDCSPTGGSAVTLRPKVVPTTLEQELPFEQCAVVQQDNFVIYNIRSERVRIYETEGGELVWDSEWTAQTGGARGPFGFSW